MKIGDKVRFLNSVGGGVVKAFQGKNMVLVEDESGFDFPVLMAECVIVEQQPPAQTVRPGVVSHVAPPQPAAPVAPVVELPIEETPEGERLHLSLAYLPVDPHTMIQAKYEAYLINESNYYLSFTYLACNNNSWHCRYQGVIEPNTKIFLEEFGQQQLNELEHLCLQLIAYKKKKPFSLKNSYSVELRLDTVKFYKKHCFVENDYFDEDALVVPVIQHDLSEKHLLISTTELQESMVQKRESERRKPQVVAKKQRAEEGPLEVDLHIRQLLDHSEGMSPSEILEYQMDQFHAILKEHSKNKGKKIIFIHGKGEGVLRAQIEKALKTQYKTYQYQDASFREYGYGATMVKIV